MINNYGKNLYHSIRNFEVEKDEAKPKGSGLLAPVRSFMQKKTMRLTHQRKRGKSTPIIQFLKLSISLQDS